MKTDNIDQGRYLAELTKEVFATNEEMRYQLSEYRISIYGKNPEEWSKLGRWFCHHKIYSDSARWLIQIPRLYSAYSSAGLVSNFQELLTNIFQPMFAATVDPTTNPQVFAMLQQVVGLDSVDDESAPPSKLPLADCPPPQRWTSSDNPPYSYWQYYLQSNLSVLNRLREERGLNTLSYRPHSGEAGPVDNIACSFLLANGINHGLKLKESPVLQYLYYVTQLPIAMSPLSNAVSSCVKLIDSSSVSKVCWFADVTTAFPYFSEVRLIGSLRRV
jgi:AMP deaminase